MALNQQRFAQICEAHDVLSNGKHFLPNLGKDC